MMHSKPLKYTALNISAATTALVKGILVLYPEAHILPCVTPLEDEDISLEVALPLRMEEIYAEYRKCVTSHPSCPCPAARACGLPAADRADQPLTRSVRAHPVLGSVEKAV